MRILDVGCGAGDVALLAAELVGESGAVVGIDRSKVAILAARARAATAKNVHFLVASPDDTLDAAAKLDGKISYSLTNNLETNTQLSMRSKNHEHQNEPID
jgi:SAM-dependent methyltransferase